MTSSSFLVWTTSTCVQFVCWHCVILFRLAVVIVFAIFVFFGVSSKQLQKIFVTFAYFALQHEDNANNSIVACYLCYQA